MGFFVKRACSHRSIGGTGDQYTPNRTLELRQRAYELNRTVYSARFQCERGAVRPSSLNLRLGRFPTYLIIRDAAVRAVTKGRIPGGLATTQIGNAVLGSPENLGHKSAAGMGAVTEGLT